MTTVSAETVQQPDLFGQPVADAVSTSVADVAATTSESTAGASSGTAAGTTQTTQQATNTPASNPDPIVVVTGVPSTLTGVVRVIFRLP